MEGASAPLRTLRAARGSRHRHPWRPHALLAQGVDHARSSLLRLVASAPPRRLTHTRRFLRISSDRRRDGALQSFQLQGVERIQLNHLVEACEQRAGKRGGRAYERDEVEGVRTEWSCKQDSWARRQWWLVTRRRWRRRRRQRTGVRHGDEQSHHQHVQERVDQAAQRHHENRKGRQREKLPHDNSFAQRGVDAR